MLGVNGPYRARQSLVRLSVQVREVCTELLQQYPAVEFVNMTLTTLSQLAAKSLMDLPQQVSTQFV